MTTSQWPGSNGCEAGPGFILAGQSELSDESPGQGAEIVSTTGEASFRSCVEEARALFRKNTVAAVGSVEIAPDARLTCAVVNVENPEPESSDQRMGELRVAREALDPIESTHASVALTLSERPCVDAFTFPTLTAGATDAAMRPTCTFTRGGTLTVTV